MFVTKKVFQTLRSGVNDVKLFSSSPILGQNKLQQVFIFQFNIFE